MFYVYLFGAAILEFILIISLITAIKKFVPLQYQKYLMSMETGQYDKIHSIDLFFLMCVVGPTLEELVFRWIFFLILPINTITIVLNAIIFMWVHNPKYFIALPQVLGAIALCYIYIHYGLFTAILYHGIYNTFCFIMVLIDRYNKSKPEIEPEPVKFAVNPYDTA